MFRSLKLAANSWRTNAAVVTAVATGGVLTYKIKSSSSFYSSDSILQASGHHNYARRLYPASAEYPECAKNRNIMSRLLTPGLYARLCDKRTANGFTLDDAIQPGVDNIGKFSWTGLVAGDAESYDTFAELFNKVIAEKHDGFTSTQRHVTDLKETPAKKIPAFSDPSCVLSIRLRMLRNLRGYTFPAFCTRGERRDIESILVKSLYKAGGVYFGLQNLSEKEEARLVSSGVWMERPFYPQDLSANFARDWPDARGIWLSDDRTMQANLNRRDHLNVSLVEKSEDMSAAFAKLASFMQQIDSNIKEEKWEMCRHERLGYLTSDPKNVGTALKLSVRVRLPKLSKDPRLATLLKMLKLSQSFKVLQSEEQSKSAAEDDKETPDAPSVIEVSSSLTLGKSEVEITQMFVESINKLIEAEKLIENGQTLDAVLYSN